MPFCLKSVDCFAPGEVCHVLIAIIIIIFFSSHKTAVTLLFILITAHKLSFSLHSHALYTLQVPLYACT